MEKGNEIEFINEDEIIELGGAKRDLVKDDNVCGNLRECTINNAKCPRLERCGWN